MPFTSAEAENAKRDAPAPVHATTAGELIEPSAETNVLDCSNHPQNEVTGKMLLLIHMAICLCTFLVGLVCISVDIVDK